MSKISVEKPHRENNLSWFRVIVAVLVVLVVLFVIFAPGPIPRERVYLIKCKANLCTLRVALRFYAHEYDNVYPTPEKWCDLLLQHAGITEKQFVCRGAFKKGNQKLCHYAINPNAEPNSPEDIVLLFETNGGWNQFGGPELLTTENHKGKGCNVLFNDGYVEFVKPEQITELKWGAEEKDSESIE